MRGRPFGTKRRPKAIDAAHALLRGEFEDLRTAATAYCPFNARTDDRFRDFVGYVEEEYRKLLSEGHTGGSLRKTFGPLTKRTLNRRRQPSERKKFMDGLKNDLGLGPSD